MNAVCSGDRRTRGTCNLCVARSGLCSVESERRREGSIGIDIPFQLGNLLLRGGDGIGAGDEAARRRLLAGNRDERACELGRVARLAAILGFPKLDERPSALVVVGDGRLGVVRRLLREPIVGGLLRRPRLTERVPGPARPHLWRSRVSERRSAF